MNILAKSTSWYRLIFMAVLFSVCIGNVYGQPANRNKSGEIIYHVFLRSFYDSNNDGIGDLNGLRQKLDYLQNLGVTSILLLPLHDATCYHNYFINHNANSVT